MVFAVVLDRHHLLFPTHIQISHEPAVGNPDLRNGPWETGIDENEPQPALFRRLRAAVHKR